MVAKSNGRWIQGVVKKMKEKGTTGAFTDWCHKKGYKSVSACAKATKTRYANQKWRKASNPAEAKRDYLRASLALTFEGMRKTKPNGKGKK